MGDEKVKAKAGRPLVADREGEGGKTCVSLGRASDLKVGGKEAPKPNCSDGFVLVVEDDQGREGIGIVDIPRDAR